MERELRLDGQARSRVPLADEVRDLIAREFIFSNAVPPGELLPSEKELSAGYGVSRVTLRAGMRSLQEAGLINIRHGVGSVVLPRPRAVTHGLDRLCSLETFAREAGRLVETEDLEWAEIPADAEMAARLDVRVGHPVLVIRRIKVYGGSRVAWIIDVVPEGVLSFETLKAEFAGSVLDVLLSHGEAGLEYADSEIAPVKLQVDIACRLGVAEGTAALFIDALARTADGRSIEWARSWLLPEHFHFSVRRRRRFGQ